MDNNALPILTSLGIPLVAGYSFLNLVLRRNFLDFPTRIAIAYGIGFGILAQWMLILGIFHKTYSFNIIAFPLILFTIICILLGYLREKLKTAPRDTPRLQTPETLYSSFLKNPLKLKALILIFSFFILSQCYFVQKSSSLLPINTWDAISTIAFKAKIIYYDQTLPDLNKLTHKTYPLFTSFTEAWVAFNLGHWDDQLIKIIFPCAFFCFLLIFYSFISSFTNPVWALAGCSLLLSANIFIYHATIAYRDFFLMYYHCLAIMLLIWWNKHQERGLLLTSALLAGFASFVKLEGTSYLVLYLILFFIILQSHKLKTLTDKIKDILLFTIPSVGICFVFHLYKIIHHITKEGTGAVDKTGFDFSLEKLKLIPTILRSFWNNLFLLENWNLVWAMAALCLFIYKRRQKKFETNLLLISIIFFFILYSALALFTTNYLWIAGLQQHTTLPRLILHFYPLSVLFIIFVNFPANNSNKKSLGS